MTRKENFEKIAKAYYEAYRAQATCLGKTPLDYDEWLETDKSTAPGFKEDKKCSSNCDNSCLTYENLSSMYDDLISKGLIPRGSFDKFLESMKVLFESIDNKDTSGLCGYVPKRPPQAKVQAKKLNQADDFNYLKEDDFNYGKMAGVTAPQTPVETIYVHTPDGTNLRGEAAKQWLREHGDNDFFSWFSNRPGWSW